MAQRQNIGTATAAFLYVDYGGVQVLVSDTGTGGSFADWPEFRFDLYNPKGYPGTDNRNQSIPYATVDQSWRVPGFAWTNLRSPFVNQFSLTLPVWLPVPSVAIAGIIARLRRSRRASKGECVSCGYASRSKASRCPECGLQNPQALSA